MDSSPSYPAFQGALSSRKPIDTVYLVDDDEVQRLFIERLCDSASLNVRCFASPGDFLSAADDLEPGCLLIDMLMPEMDGIALFDEIERRKLPFTSILITGFGDIQACRMAFRAGMFDYIEKDSSALEILSTIKSALEHLANSIGTEDCAIGTLNHNDCPQLAFQVHGLSERENQVAQLLIEGQSLKQIGNELGISVQTASKHRTRIFSKVGVSNEIELLKRMQAQ